MPPREVDRKVSVALGRAIRKFRDVKRMTQAELGEKTGIGERAVGRIERGERDPIASVCVDIAKALGIRPGRLFDEMERQQAAGASVGKDE